MKPEELARSADRLNITQPAIIRSAIIALYIPDRAAIQAAWLDLVGVKHDGGQIDMENLSRPAAALDLIEAAASQFVEQHATDEAFYYLLAIAVLESEHWPNLREWLEQFEAQRAHPNELAADQHGSRAASIQWKADTSAGVSPDLDASIGSASKPNSQPPDQDIAEKEDDDEEASVSTTGIHLTGGTADLTPLDHQLIFAVVDAAQGVSNHLSKETVDAIVDEFVRLNGRRVQSYYHLGFRDVLFGRPLATTLPASNIDRLRWYLSGYIVGLERHRQTDRILELFDNDAIVQGLGDTGLGPSKQGAPLVFGALVTAERYAEAAEFVGERAAFTSRALNERMLSAATALLRAQRPAEARPLLDKLWNALASRKAADLPVGASLWSDVRRRRAHCLRYENNLEGAREMLEELVEDRKDVDPGVLVHALVDLGLIAARYRQLADLEFPENEADRSDVLTALDRGRSYVREALEIPDINPGHAHYVEGFRALITGDAHDALYHLDRALVTFESRPEVYRPGGLLSKARLHVAIAICQTVTEISQVSRAAELLASALKDGVTIPRYLVESILESLALTDVDAAREAAEAILEASSTNVLVLDELGRSAAARQSTLITNALLRRARDEKRSVGKRAEDSLLALPLLLAQGRNEEAASLLDQLELVARRSIETDRFLEVLSDHRKYSPAWDPEDALWARVQCLEASARYEEAAVLLRDELHRSLAAGGWGAIEDAEELADRVAGYPPPSNMIADFMHQCIDARREPGDSGSTSPASGITIDVLYVGGDVTEERHDEAVKQRLREFRSDIRVQFLHTGWTSNWGDQVEEFKRRVASVDAVVFSRFMRTMFGRTVRQLCRVPWRGCGGRGRKSIETSILLVAGMAERARRSNTATALPAESTQGRSRRPR